METAFEILVSLVELVIAIGIIVFVVKLVTRKGSSSAEGSSVTSELVTVHGEIFPRSFDFSISGGNLDLSNLPW